MIEEFKENDHITYKTTEMLVKISEIDEKVDESKGSDNENFE